MSDMKSRCLTDYLQIYTKIDSYLFVSVSLVVCEMGLQPPENDR